MIYAVQLKLRPNPSHENYGRFSGARACVVVATDDPATVEERAAKHVEREGWIIESKEESYPIYREDYEHDPTQIQTIDDALLLGSAAEFYTFKSGGVQFN